MKLIVQPRWRLPALDLDVPYVVISITDPKQDPAVIPKRWGLRDILRLSFDDIDPEDLRYIPGHQLQGIRLMRPEDGQAIASFVETWKDQVGAIVIHCEAGASRSPSVAMALADSHGWGRASIEWMGSGRVPPNLHVYRVTRYACKMAVKMEETRINDQ